MKPYSPPLPTAPIELELSRNEGRAPGGLPAATCRYPNTSDLRASLAELYGVNAEQVLVTAGGDDALSRCCLATLEPGSNAVVATPTFEMIPRYVALARGELRSVAWPEGAFPRAAFLEALTESTRVAFLVSPNNPTGAVATGEDLIAIAKALPQGLVVLDAAYAEFASEDLTRTALELENVVIVRTLSKAWGLAGLRVGCLLGTPAKLELLAASGHPYPVSSASISIAQERIDDGVNEMRSYVARIRDERASLTRTLTDLGARPVASEANFVLARNVDAPFLASSAASLGVGLRAFPGREDLTDAVRITLPGDPQEFERLERTLRTSLAPEALLFDMDGVLADVSCSYRAAIVETARTFGVELTAEDIEAAKEAGGANDDWALTHGLIEAKGGQASLPRVTQAFEALYQGGLSDEERLLVPKAKLTEWKQRFPLAIVTGRPRQDAFRFLERFDLLPLFDEVICREDAALKPDPAPARLALERLGVKSAWMLGDTRDDLDAARGAGVLPLGVIAPGSDPGRGRAALTRAGAAAVLETTPDLEDLLR